MDQRAPPTRPTRRINPITSLLATALLLIIFTSSTYYYNTEQKQLNNEDATTRTRAAAAVSSPSSTSIRRRLAGGPAGVAWLMSFPNSGTTYTERLIESVTQYTVATNYGHEHVDENGEPEHVLTSVPVFEGGKNGPFRLSSKDLPEGGYILTKTHCGGYCFSDCPPNWYILSTEQYLQECIRGARFEEREGGTTERFWVQYDPSFAKRAVHLFRDPFDNIVSRFHHEFKTRTNQKDNEWLDKYPNAPYGFRAWCRDSDERFKEREPVFFDAEMVKAFEGVPCHGEFFRWVQWHNNAFELIKRLGIEDHVVHYMDYGLEFDKTVRGILKFVDLEWVGDAPPFKMLAYDDRYYSQEERDKITGFMKFVASERTWKEMARYVNNSADGAADTQKTGEEQMADILNQAASAPFPPAPESLQEDQG